ncbi:MAG: protein tyrosine phosphatase [Deltaproteobacteria bacterium]|nr:protein tyrosine phosphatase [Deltaproteobacteria bacterium]
MLNVVFVCTGNICRSPMAEGLLQYKWHQTERDDIHVSSMGIYGLNDSPATEYAQAVCKKNGFDISSHRARSLVGEELMKADLILCMEPAHKKFVRVFFPWHRDKVALLGAWPDKQTRKSSIEDPMGGSYKKYQKIFSIIKMHIERILPLLLSRYNL